MIFSNKLYGPNGSGKFTRTTGAIVVFCAFAAVWAGVRAQAQSKAAASSSGTASSSTANNIPPRPAPACCGYPFPRSTDAEIADSDVHRVLYEDQHIMFLEVSNPPGLHVKMHGHPYASVFLHDSTTGAKDPNAAPPPPDGVNAQLDPGSSFNNMGGINAPPPTGLKWPTCTDSAPQAPHQGPYDSDLAPNHFFRVELLHLEGDDFQTHWKEWYPSMTEPAKPVKDLVPGPALGPKFSGQWPYPIVYDSIQAAPQNYQLLYEDGKMRVIEVTIRPGETTPMHGHPYPSVLVYNSISGDPSVVTETMLDPGSPLNGQGAGHAAAPKLYGLKVPLCATMAQQAPHKIHNGGSVPLHYYRIEYKRIDGDGLTAHWREWYPWMKYMQFMR